LYSFFRQIGAQIGGRSGNTGCLQLRLGGILVLAWGQLSRLAALARWQNLSDVVGRGLNVAVLAFGLGFCLGFLSLFPIRKYVTYSASRLYSIELS